eukprot:s200_g3.t1
MLVYQRVDSPPWQDHPCESSLSATSRHGGNSAVKGSRVTGAAQETVDKSKVVPPWGPERANQDRRDVVVQKRLEYRQLLDEQNAKMADQHRQQRVEQAELEKNSIPSLATKTHEWEKHTEGDWKALMKDEKTELKQREEEQRSCREHLDQAAKERALRYYTTRRRLKEEEVCELTEEWMKVTEEKRRLKDQQRRKDLDLEQKALEELMAGMAPPRRLRKPVSLCDYYPEPPKTIR